MLLDHHFKTAFFNDGDSIEAAKSAHNGKMQEINMTNNMDIDIAPEKEKDNNSFSQKVQFI